MRRGQAEQNTNRPGEEVQPIVNFRLTPGEFKQFMEAVTMLGMTRAELGALAFRKGYPEAVTEMLQERTALLKQMAASVKKGNSALVHKPATKILTEAIAAKKKSLARLLEKRVDEQKDK